MRRWCEQRGRVPSGLMSMATAWALAQAWYHDRMSPSFVRPSRAEIEALFNRLGLTGPAWTLPAPTP